jgi:hypothetical protein
MTLYKPEIGPGFFDDLGSEDMSPIKAFNEMIANSIDSWIEKGTTQKDRGQLEIQIFFTDDHIVITDNAGGMKRQDMLNAMGFGMAQKGKKPQGDDLMGTYGFGLKASTSALGRHFEVISKPLNGKIVHSVMPIGKMKDENSWQADIEEKINPKSITDKKTITKYLKLGKSDSGTMIYIADIREGLDVETWETNKYLLMQELGMSWKSFINDNKFGKSVKIYFNGDLIKEPQRGYDQKGQLPNTEITFEFPITFDTKTGEKTTTHNEIVKGSIWVNREGGQGADSGGFNTYRKGQLVQRHDQKIFNVNVENARVEGELYLDFVPANQRKTYFDEKHPAYKAVKKYLKTFVPKAAVNSKKLNVPVIKDPSLLNRWIVEEWYGHYMTIFPNLELPKELKRLKKIDPPPGGGGGGYTPPGGGGGGYTPPGGGGGYTPGPKPVPDEEFIPLSEDSFKYNDTTYTIIYMKGNCGGNVYAYKVDKNRIQINVDDSVVDVSSSFKSSMTKIVDGPSASGYAKIAKQLITQNVIQQFLTRTLGANEALKQSQIWLKFVNKK